MKILLSLATAISAISLFSTPALAQMIDEFDGEIAATSSGFTYDDSNILGAERDFGGSPNVSVAFSGGQLEYNSLTGIAPAQFYYDGNDDNPALNFGLGGIDLTANGADRFLVFISSFTAVSATLAITIYEDGSNASRAGPIVITSTGLYEVPFSDLTFDTGAGADISSVNALQFTVSDNTASGGPGSVTVDYFRTNAVNETIFEDGFEE